MRAMFMVVASIVLAVGLFGCNRQQQVAEQAPVAVMPPPPVAAPPPPPAPVMEATRPVRHPHYRARHSSYESYSGSESASYSQSDESGYEDESASESEVYDRSSAAAEAHGEVWVDGYGREHYSAATPDDNPGALSREDERLRRKPYRGWNSDCDRR